jgi:MarR family 2-MHQ and catechol resistance regulon transcriptional repressor
MPTQYAGTLDAKRALNAYIALMRASDSVSARVHRHLAAAGLSISQFGVLEILHHLGPLSPRDLCSKLLRSSGNVTLILDNLEKRDLIRRERDQRDRRMVTIHLTEAGQALIAEVFPRQVDAIQTDLSVLNPAEQDELRRLCRKLGLQQG